MSLHTNTKLPAVPRLSSRGRSSGEGYPTALPKLFRSWRAIVCGNPAAIRLYRAARYEAACLRAVRDAVDNARPADGGASASLAQPVPYDALHGETGEGFETLRRRFDLPSSVTVVLALGFILPIMIIAIVKHGGIG